MFPLKLFIKKIKNNKLFFLIYLPFMILILILSMAVLMYPEIAAAGVNHGISLCLEVLIPYLYPFLVLSTLMCETGLFNFFEKKCGKITEFLFRLPGVTLPIMLMSMTGGYPVGGILIKEAYEKRKITAEQGRRMMLFCVNPGPAFVISTIGVKIAGSATVGWIFLVSALCSSFTVGILTRFLENKEKDFFQGKKADTEIPSVGEKICIGVNKSLHSMSSVCLWVIIFSCLYKLTDTIDSDGNFKLVLGAFSEVTNGIVEAYGTLSLPLIGGIIGFSGFCVHLQLVPVMIKLKLKYRYFFVARVLNGALSCIVSSFLFSMFSEKIQVFASGSSSFTKPGLSTSPTVAVCIFLMCGLLIVGDTYISFGRRKNNKTEKCEKPYLY